MMKKLLLSFFCLACFSLVTGCDGGGTAEFDPSAADAYTEADESAAEDYEAQRKKELEEQY